MKLDIIIEHLQEMGKICIDDYDNSLEDLQERLKRNGYNTTLISTDRLYLQLVQ